MGRVVFILTGERIENLDELLIKHGWVGKKLYGRYDTGVKDVLNDIIEAFRNGGVIVGYLPYYAQWINTYLKMNRVDKAKRQEILEKYGLPDVKLRESDIELYTYKNGKLVKTEFERIEGTDIRIVPYTEYYDTLIMLYNITNEIDEALGL